jgi:predicted transcriptional regulator
LKISGGITVKVSELADKLGLTIFGGASGLQNEIKGGYTSDLLSDVMGHACSNQVWITVQTHKNVIAVASLKELASIILIKGLEPAQEVIEQSDIEKIPLLGTKEEAFEITGKIYNILKG